MCAPSETLSESTIRRQDWFQDRRGRPTLCRPPSAESPPNWNTGLRDRQSHAQAHSQKGDTHGCGSSLSVLADLRSNWVTLNRMVAEEIRP